MTRFTANYSIEKRDAQQIDWSDEDVVQAVIDWSPYRNFVHPAIKQD